MTDSFFTARTYIDSQLEDQCASVDACQALIEGAARRMAKLEGPTAAAVRLQRIADICAVAQLAPIHHWKSSTVQAVAKPAPKSRKRRVIELVAAHGHWFAAGMAFNMMLRALLMMLP